MLPQFDLKEPRTLSEALDALAEDAAALPLCGGTNLLPDIRAKRPKGLRLVSLAGLAELRRIDCGEAEIVIGARTTLNEILRSPGLRRAAPGLVQSAAVFAGFLLRNSATVGGNVCYGSPSADAVPPLLALDARVTLAGRSASRSVPLDEFYLGYKKTARRPDEVLVAISWPRPRRETASLFHKLGLRKGDAISVVGAAVAVSRANGKCGEARIALGSVAPTVFRAKAAEAMLAGAAVTPALIEEAARRAADEARPITDLRASAEYRRHAAYVVVRRLLTQAWDQLH
jgi:carbon-monoxide dehydrogenase medium subunit